MVYCGFFVLFFFKQKTAYEMRISDWSSDVCSSDLRSARHRNAIQVVLVGILDQNRDDVARRMARRVAKQHIAVDLGRVGLRSPGRAAVLVHRVEDHVQRAADLRPKLGGGDVSARSEEHTSELQSLMRISYAVFGLKKKK